jgi:alpha-L-rhamnosidase
MAEPESSHSPARELAFGAVGEWMYDAIGGIALDPQAPAGRHVIVRPRPGAGLTQARATFDSPRGRVETAWTMEGKNFRLKLVLPPGSTATVTLPFVGSITESGKPVKGRVVEVESGSYEFFVQPS